ncbi:hypothetical protein HPB50_003675 [Hyalomma asiaticum]|uniref:Uncharacterized protein n=1 Tax=Hyalomma asiaticum TaxID=266040 RepID=A0ACB7SX38_HYAAI|nr:hypothetical protein HPB50_003675 [Hyalomma asiaticum]
MKTQTLLCLCGLSLVPLLLSIEARSLASIKEKSDNQVTGRTGMLSRFEPLISNMVVPFLVATGVVSLVRMVPSVVSQIPNVFGFAKRHGYTELPREVLEIMQMLDGANIKYDVQQHQPQQHVYHTTNQRYPLYHQQQIYKAAAAAASSSSKPQSQQG